MIDRIGPTRPTRLYIREWMEAVNPTLDNERLAERMGIAPGTLSKLLNGRMKMTVEYLEGIASAIGVDDVAKLFHDPKRPTVDELLRGLPPDEERRVISMVEHMVKLAKTGTDG